MSSPSADFFIKSIVRRQYKIRFSHRMGASSGFGSEILNNDTAYPAASRYGINPPPTNFVNLD